MRQSQPRREGWQQEVLAHALRCNVAYNQHRQQSKTVDGEVVRRGAEIRGGIVDLQRPRRQQQSAAHDQGLVERLCCLALRSVVGRGRDDRVGRR